MPDLSFITKQLEISTIIYTFILILLFLLEIEGYVPLIIFSTLFFVCLVINKLIINYINKLY